MLSKFASAPLRLHSLRCFPMRVFSTDKKPPKGFEKFFRKRPDQQQDPKSSPDPPKPPPADPDPPNKPSFDYSSFRKDFKDFNPKPPPNALLLAAIGSLAVLLWSFPEQKQTEVIAVQELARKYIDPDLVKKVVIEMPRPNEVRTTGLYTVLACNASDEVLAELKVPNVPNFLAMLEFEQSLLNRERNRWVQIEYRYEEGTSAQETGKFLEKNIMPIANLVFLVAIATLLYRFSKQGKTGGSSGGFDLFNMSKSTFKVYGTDIKIDTRFKDVAGLNEAKKEIMEFVDFLKKPEKFLKLGAKIPKGALLVGPPGTGKTLLAKAAAGEAGVPFYTVSGSDFVEMFVGVGASRVRQLFNQAKERAPSIIFIDEIDAVGRKRHGKVGGNDEKDQTLNQLLVEMDGFGTDTHVVVLAGTNRKDILDGALLRPGRFDRTIELTLPDIDGREQILLLHLAPITLNPEIPVAQYAKRLAALTPGFSGADLANICNEAAILAARKNKESVDKTDFEVAAERIIGGLESSKKLDPKDRQIVAYHESGHAAAAWFLEGADPVLKVSILPRSKGALGFAQFLPHETMLYSKSELLDKICATLAGRVAEEIFFHKITTGAQNDLQKATEIAMALVTSFGMSAKMGPVGYSMDKETFGKPFSQATNRLIDEEVRAIVQSCLERTRTLLTEKKPLIDALALKLLEKERILHRDLVDALGPRPFPIRSEYEKYVNEDQTAATS